VALAAGKTVSKTIDTGITFVTLNNLDAEQSQ
jgi:predicted aspartyl protease